MRGDAILAAAAVIADREPAGCVGIYLSSASSGIAGRLPMLRKSLNIMLISAAIMTIVACNTVSGAGEDLKSASNAVANEMH
jgi:predicted small secreted protein